MSPWLQFVHLAGRHGAGNPYNQREAHLERGFFYSDPLKMAMARPISSKWSEKSILDPWDDSLSELDLTLPLDCWYVWVAIGDLRELLALLPYPLPFIAFHRYGRTGMRIYNFKSFLDHGSTIRTGATKDAAASLRHGRGDDGEAAQSTPSRA